MAAPCLYGWVSLYMPLSLPRGVAALTWCLLVPQPVRMSWSQCSTAWRAAPHFLSASPAHPRPPLSGCSSEIPMTGAVR